MQELRSLLRSLKGRIADVAHFTKLADRAISEHGKTFSGVNERIAAALAGEPPKENLGDDTISVKLSVDEANALKGIAEDEVKVSERHPSLLREMALVYTLAQFESFVYDSLLTVLVCRPEVLRRGQERKSVSYKTVLDSMDSKDSLVRSIAERELSQIFYKSAKDQPEALANSLGIDLDWSSEDLRKLEVAMAKRNLLVHNGGLVNEIYLGTDSDCGISLGQPISVESEYLSDSQSLLVRRGEEITELLVSKFD